MRLLFGCGVVNRSTRRSRTGQETSSSARAARRGHDRQELGMANLEQNLGWIDVRVTLMLHEPACTPEVRLWIDLEPDDGLDNESPLPLRRVGHDWLGAFSIGETASARFFYRLALLAHPGAEFWLSLRDRDRDHDLLIDGDILGAKKCVLVGTCEATRAVSARRAPRLMLLAGGKGSVVRR
jgi:hypothetical protein